ncbi:helix-turn-helix transcriptional regulator [Aureimonas altamirensis]|uniref:helix-turn-helix domain-containing protein n=1 Tax=Aureimonas altamirensis TaxID=370622 RepID=UPI001E489612|nr:helix-turn-helix transcriptional regulator [Aureimonas altamirensis]UHD45354.1 helix-turn-helix transcriptional regulator [Aureimonas altamirensis]
MSVSDNRIAEIRKSKSVTQSELAELVGSHPITISKLERGKMKLTIDWIVRIAAALSVHPSELWIPSDRLHLVNLRGVIQGGVTAQMSDAEYQRDFVLSDHEEEASYWILVGDDQMLPYFSKNDALRFTQFFLDAAETYSGRISHLTLSDGRSLIGVLIVNSENTSKRPDVRLLNGTMISDADVQAGAYLSMALCSPDNPSEKIRIVDDSAENGN